MARLTENIFIEELKDGNEKAFELLFKCEFENAVFYANQFIKNELISRDVVQESFIALWNSKDKIKSEVPVMPYFYKIVRNKSLNILRDKLINAGDLERTAVDCDILVLMDESVTSSYDNSRLEKMIKEAWESLPEKLKESFKLSRNDGLSYEEIALIKGIKTKAVEYQISLAIKHFRKKLRGYVTVFLVLLWLYVL